MNALIQNLRRDRKDLGFCLLAAFLWGFAAHGYSFTDNSFSHDSLNELHGAIFGSTWKVELGRAFVPFYRDLVRGDATVPWLIGILSLAFLGLSVFFLTRIFRIQSKGLTVVTAGILTVNLSVCAIAATYLHDLDCYMLSLLCAVLAVYLWKESRRGFLPGAVLIAGSLGLYQGYISSAIVLIMLVCMLDLLQGQAFRDVLFRGLKAIGMLLLGGVLYYAALQAVLGIFDVTLASGSYNSMGRILELTPKLFLELTVDAYRDWFRRLFHASSAYPAALITGVTALLALISAAAVAAALVCKTLRWPEKLLLLALTALLPLGMNLLYVLNLGEIHDVMVYAIWLFYLAALLLGRWLAERWASLWQMDRLIRWGAAALVTLLLWGNVQFANGMYLKKDLEYDAYLSLMTRVVSRLEDTEGYVPQQTQVFFQGLPENLNSVTPGFKEYTLVTGMEGSDLLMAPTRERYQAYFSYVMGVPILLAEEARWTQLQTDPQVAQMPCYPEEGCIAWVEDVLVVKLGRWEIREADLQQGAG